MRKIYSINYDLPKPGTNYDGLIREIKTRGHWFHYLDSHWLILTDESASEISSRLRQHIDNNDRLLVSEFGPDRDGWLPEKAWQWIRGQMELVEA